MMEKEFPEHPKARRKRTKKAEERRLWLLLIVVCICVMAFSLWQLLSIFLEYKAGTDEYEDLQQYVMAEIPEETEETGNLPEEEPETEEAGEERLQRVSFGDLKQINSDIVGWIEIPDTGISYPILQGEDNAYYLNHTFRDNVNSAGSIFLEALNAADFSDYHTLIYGHNMKNGSMFGTLSYYRSPTYLVAHPCIYIDTENGQYKYQIFSCYETEADSDSYTIGFVPDEVYAEYLATIKGRSEYDTGVDVSVEDHILSLSTCTKSGQNRRYLIHAKRVE